MRVGKRRVVRCPIVRRIADVKRVCVRGPIANAGSVPAGASRAGCWTSREQAAANSGCPVKGAGISKGAKLLVVVPVSSQDRNIIPDDADWSRAAKSVVPYVDWTKCLMRPSPRTGSGIKNV